MRSYTVDWQEPWALVEVIGELVEVQNYLTRVSSMQTRTLIFLPINHWASALGRKLPFDYDCLRPEADGCRRLPSDRFRLKAEARQQPLPGTSVDPSK